jgi:hypothetical protein
MATTTNFGWETPDDTDLVKDGALAIRTLGSAIDTSLVDLKGGTTGQVLSKNSNTDMDFTWVTSDDANAIQNAIVDAKGDLITATAADTPARLAVGTNGHVLTADSTTATGLKWAAAAGGGKVLQVIQSQATSTTTVSSSTYTDATGLSASITPADNTNKVLVTVVFDWQINSTSAGAGLDIKLLRGSTEIVKSLVIGQVSGVTGYKTGVYVIHYYDSPATTSSTTYKIQFANDYNGAQVAVNPYGTGYNNATITLMEIDA